MWLTGAAYVRKVMKIEITFFKTVIIVRKCGVLSSTSGILLGSIITTLNIVSKAGIACLRIVMWVSCGKSLFLISGGESRKKETT